jgi:hypothetical protein
LSDALRGAATVVASVSGRRDGKPEQIPALAERLLHAASEAGVARLLWVGGAGSLQVVPGLRLVDTPEFPPEVKPESLAQADALEIFRRNLTDVRWSYFSPPVELELEADGGEPYVIEATEDVLRDEDGRSRIALADYARAAVDELGAPRFDGARFTIAARRSGGAGESASTGHAVTAQVA